MKPIIEIKQLGKKYRIEKNDRYLSLREEMSNGIRNLFKNKSSKQEDFWALKDINLTIEPGERVGVIGRNGAGKSTLLKILSRVTAPTKGEAIIRGRLASLLEVGTGFHPELTGKENIYLNGAILGMKKDEIDRQYDAIVDFSGVEKFLSTPLKNYSSGMQMRLAFAVAAHLEPEILLIDEVLAVGDMEFQKKCIGKMEEVSKKQGRAIVFVSHNLEAVRRLCTQAVLLEHGKLKTKDLTQNTIKEYLRNDGDTPGLRKWDKGKYYSDSKKVFLNEMYVHQEDYTLNEIHEVTATVGITFTFIVTEPLPPFTHGISLFDMAGNNIFNAHDTSSDLRLKIREPAKYKVTAWIPGNLLAEGTYSICIAAMEVSGSNEVHFYEPDCIYFTIVDSISGNSARGNYAGDFPGLTRPKLSWQSIKLE